MYITRFLYIMSVAAAALAGGPGAPSDAGTGWRNPLHVAVDRTGRMFVDGSRVDTLRVFRGQIVYWEKRDPSGPDLTVQFERKLFHKRNRVRVPITDRGRARFVRVSQRARMRVYFGNPEEGFDAERVEPDMLQIMVVPPPESQQRR